MIFEKGQMRTILGIANQQQKRCRESGFAHSRFALRLCPFARLCFLPISLILPVHPEFLQVHGWLSLVMTVPPALPSSPVDRFFLPAKSDNPWARESTTLFVSQTEL